MESPATSVPRKQPTGRCRRRPRPARMSHKQTRRSRPALATTLGLEGSAANPKTLPRCPSPDKRLPRVYARRKSPLPWAKSQTLIVESKPARKSLPRSSVKVMAVSSPDPIAALDTNLGDASEDTSHMPTVPLMSTAASRSCWSSGTQRRLVTASMSGIFQSSTAKPVQVPATCAPAACAGASVKLSRWSCRCEPVWKTRTQPSKKPPAKRVPHGEKRNAKQAES
mmetsp:Transcript_102150/g.294134  ORF Transcript_102150/g.294134 Transcript_102150/m.294134 type:complete len:225 (-) Transcript_102150:192-866(-)